MTKLPLIALVSLLGLGLAGAAAPASAASIASCRDDVQHSISPTGYGTYESEIDANSASILSSLRAKGVNAQSISDWGGCVKADVLRSDGHIALEFFDPSSLQRLSVNG
ncbi:MAG: hypothetical protein P4M09_31410 [Devosia sp.]|nr:hypothetical protein [Devosia sp.]